MAEWLYCYLTSELPLVRFRAGLFAFCIIKMAKTPNFGVRKIAIIEFTEGNKICHFVGTFAYNPIV